MKLWLSTLLTVINPFCNTLNMISQNSFKRILLFTNILRYVFWESPMRIFYSKKKKRYVCHSTRKEPFLYFIFVCVASGNIMVRLLMLGYTILSMTWLDRHMGILDWAVNCAMSGICTAGIIFQLNALLFGSDFAVIMDALFGLNENAGRIQHWSNAKIVSIPGFITKLFILILKGRFYKTNEIVGEDKLEKLLTGLTWTTVIYSCLCIQCIIIVLQLNIGTISNLIYIVSLIPLVPVPAAVVVGCGFIYNVLIDVSNCMAVLMYALSYMHSNLGWMRKHTEWVNSYRYLPNLCSCIALIIPKTKSISRS